MYLLVPRLARQLRQADGGVGACRKSAPLPPRVGEERDEAGNPIRGDHLSMEKSRAQINEDLGKIPRASVVDETEVLRLLSVQQVAQQRPRSVL